VRVMVALDNRFSKTKNGSIYSLNVCDYTFWQRYLKVFDEVVVFARVVEVDETELQKQPANGAGVRFKPLPYFIGPWQYLRNLPALNRLARDSLGEAEAFILRIPGTVASLVWRYLRKNNVPYGIEVTGDPWEALSIENVSSLAGPVARFLMTRNTKIQCRGAAAAGYVTEKLLQLKYPCRCWSTHFSSIELPDSTIVGEERIAQRLALFDDAINQKRPFRICHVGSMDALYKAQDILMDAVAICSRKGLNIELTFVGGGRHSPYFVNKAQKIGIRERVKFLGELPPGEPVIEQLDKADLFVLPSTTEGLPRALIEAMARALPCLGSDVGGIQELLQPDDRFPAGDANLLAARIESVLGDQNRLARMAQWNVEKAKAYCKQELDRRRTALYRKLAELTQREKTRCTRNYQQ